MATSSAAATAGAGPDIGRRARGAWSVVDQALSSLSNMAVTVAVARQVGVADLGGFSIAYLAYTILLGLTRAVTSEPLTVRWSAADPSTVRRAAAAAAGTAAVVAVVAAVPLLAAPWYSPSAVAGPLVALALFLPGLLVQDTWRFAFLTSSRPKAAAVNDGVWVAVQLLLFLLVPVLAVPSGATYLGAWGMAACVAAAVGCLQAGAVPAPARARPWLRDHARLIRAFLFEFAARAGARQLTIAVVGVTSGLAALGAIRGGQIVFGPLNVVLLGVSMAAVPEAVRLGRRGAGAVVAYCDRLVTGLCAACAAFTVVALAAPSGIGRAVLGQSWVDARGLFAAQGVLLASIAACSGYLVGLRALEDIRSSVVVRATIIPATVAGGALGALVDGGRGLLVGLAVANLVGSVLFRRGLSRAAAPGAATERLRRRTGPTPRPLSPDR